MGAAAGAAGFVGAAAAGGVGGAGMAGGGLAGALMGNMYNIRSDGCCNFCSADFLTSEEWIRTEPDVRVMPACLCVCLQDTQSSLWSASLQMIQ